MQRIDRHPAVCDEDRAAESILDTKNWLDRIGDLDNPNDSSENWEANNESDIQLDNGIEDPNTPEQLDVSAAPNVPRLIRPTERSKKQAEKIFLTVNTITTTRNQGNKKQ